MRVSEVSMMSRILVIISPVTLTTSVGHPLGEEHFSKKTFARLYGPDYSPKCLASSDD